MRDENKIVGYLVVTKEVDYEQTYEVAAWHTIHTVQVGRYPIYGHTEFGRRSFVVDVNTIVKSSYTPSLYGGVRIGEYEDTRAGTKDTVSIGFGGYYYEHGIPYARFGTFEPVEGADLRIGVIRDERFQSYAMTYQQLREHTVNEIKSRLPEGSKLTPEYDWCIGTASLDWLVREVKRIDNDKKGGKDPFGPAYLL